MFRHTVCYLPQLAVYLRNWNNSTHACRKPWRAWKKTLEILRGSNVGGTVLKCILGPLGCYVLMKHFIQFTGLGESLMGFCRFWKINGIFVDMFSLHQQVCCIFINQIQAVVSNLLFSFRFWIFFRHVKPLWEDYCQFECRLPTSFWARSTEADHLCMVHLRKPTWTPNIPIVEKKILFQNTILRVHVSLRKCISKTVVCFNFTCNGTDVCIHLCSIWGKK